ILLPGGWIEKLNRRAVVVGCLRKIAIAFAATGSVVSWHSGVSNIRGIAARSVPSSEEEPFVATVVNLGNFQRAADIRSEARLVVLRFDSGGSVQGVGYGVQRCVVVREIKQAVRLVDVEPAATTWASTRTAEAGPATEGATATLHTVAKFLNVLLQFIFAAAAEVLCAPLRTADADGFRGAFRAGAIQGKT